MSLCQLVMFDLDGTLVQTAGEISDAVNDTLRAFQRPAVPEEQVERWIGHGTRELMVQALAKVDGRPVDAVRASAEFADVMAAFDPFYEKRCGTRSVLYPHAREVLTALRQRGVKLAVVTNKEGRYTQAVLDAHALAPLFDRVVSGDTLPVKKPHPLAIADTLLRYGVAAERALFVGDSSIDVATAREVIEVTEAHGYQMVDAPVSGGIAAANGGTLTFMVGGSDAAFARAQPILAAMGKAVIHAGDSGAGQAAKICNNMLLGISMLGTCEAIALAEKLGLDPDRFFEIASKSSGQCWSVTSYYPWAGPVPTAPSNRDYDGGFATAMMLKDLKLAQDAAAKLTD